MTSSAVIEHARDLRARAEEHKRAERRHRRRAQEAMQELVAYCAAHNIKLDIAHKEGTVNGPERS